MKKTALNILLLSAISAFASQASAVTYVEDFDDQFPAWETGWLGTNSNLTNFYGAGQGRGNNAYGLWIDDGDGFRGSDTVEIFFDALFGATILDISIDLANHVNGTTLQIFDMSGAILLNTAVSGGDVFTGAHNTYGISSTNGIKGFSLTSTLGSQIEGNTGIDNVIVNTGTSAPGPSHVPESGNTLALLGLAGALVAFLRRRFSK